MNVLRLLSLAFGFLTFHVGEEGGGAPADGGGAEPAAPAAPSAEATPAAPAAAPAAPATMQEAMFGKDSADAAPTARGTGPRDPAGKFVPKVSTDPAPVVPAAKPGAKPAAQPAAAVPATPAAPAAAAAPPAEPENPDPLAMPAGLTPKAQERFQRLANENRDLTEKADTATRQVEYVKTAFETHGVKQEQFEQATAVIGMLNRGDFEGARAALSKQLQQIELITGKKGEVIDALADFPDLRQAVDGMQMTEAYALEIARARATQHATGQRQQQERQQHQQHQQTQQAVTAGTNAVEAFCRRMQSSDVDYVAIEEQLTPVVASLLEGVPPNLWAGKVEAHYKLLKSAAGRFRQSSTPSNGNALRPTGQASPGQAPKSIHEAMWGA